MPLKKTIAALAACLALGAVGANMAQAEGICWTIEGVCLAGGKAETVEIEKNAGGIIQLTAEPLGKVTLDANKVECAAGVACTIDNAVTPNHSAGKLEFTEVTVTEPANCFVHSPGAPNGTIVTTALTDTVIMDKKVAGSTAVFDRFFPETGTALAHVEFTGATCPFNELEITLAGTLTGQVVHTIGTEVDIPSKTGEQFVTQSLLFNKAAQETGGGALTMGAKPAFLDATVNFRLNGANKGKKWGSD